MIVEKVAVILILLDIIERRQAPVLIVGQELKDYLLVVGHLVLVVVHAVRLVNRARQLNFPGWTGEVAPDLNVLVVADLLALRNVVQSASKFNWSCAACHLSW